MCVCVYVVHTCLCVLLFDLALSLSPSPSPSPSPPCPGESGLGKSTLVNTLFLTDLYGARVYPAAVGELALWCTHVGAYSINLCLGDGLVLALEYNTTEQLLLHASHARTRKLHALLP